MEKEAYQFIQNLKLEARNELTLKEKVCMANVCTICNHDSRLEIDREIVKGKSYQKIAREFNVDNQAVWRHANNHLSRQLVQAWQRKEVIENKSIIQEIENLIDRTRSILDKTEAKKQYGTALASIRELNRSYELLSKIAFEYHAAKMQELELQRRQDGSYQEELDREFWENCQEVLNDAEWDLLEKLVEKIETKDKDIDVVSDYRKDPEMEFLFAVEHSSKNGRLSELSVECAESKDDIIEVEDKPVKKMRRTKPPGWQNKSRSIEEIEKEYSTGNLHKKTGSKTVSKSRTKKGKFFD